MPARSAGLPRSPVRPATRWMRVVSMASAKVIAGRMVVSCRTSIGLPPRVDPGGYDGHNACVTFTFTRVPTGVGAGHC